MKAPIQKWRVASAYSREELEQLLNELDAKGYEPAFVFSESQNEGFNFTIVGKSYIESRRGPRAK